VPFDIEAATRLFFDRPAVSNALDRGTKRTLSRFGAFVRQRARTSIRKKKGISPAGGPPFSHLGVLRKGILFAYDPQARSVVTGPILAGSQSGAPERLEEGGTVPGNGRVVWITNTPGRDQKGRFVSDGRTRIVLTGNIAYKPRPYMGPAFKAELPKAPEMFKNQIR
jgi:hypothetical protein